MVEFVLFSLPTLIYLLVGRRDAVARPTMGLVASARQGWLLAVVLIVVSLGIGWVTTMAVPPEILHGPGTTGRITGVVAGLSVALRAVGEEVFFRGFVQGLVAKRWGPVAGVVVQGVAFLIPHLPLIAISTALVPLVAGQFVIGLLLGWLRHRARSIAPGAVAHAVVNVVVALGVLA